jgi:hypothetical protein
VAWIGSNLTGYWGSGIKEKAGASSRTPHVDFYTIKYTSHLGTAKEKLLRVGMVERSKLGQIGGSLEILG